MKYVLYDDLGVKRATAQNAMLLLATYDIIEQGWSIRSSKRTDHIYYTFGLEECNPRDSYDACVRLIHDREVFFDAIVNRSR